MKKKMSRKIGFLALLLAATLWGCDQLAVTGPDTLDPGAASLSKGQKLGAGIGDGTILDPMDFGLAWPF